MSRDRDGQQRLWLSLGYGGKTASKASWRYWRSAKGDDVWVIAAPNGLAEFEQRDRTIFLNGKALLTGETQWKATWAALAYFYKEIIIKCPEPPLSSK